jgi:DNA-binding response OmpR family regulator
MNSHISPSGLTTARQSALTPHLALKSSGHFEPIVTRHESLARTVTASNAVQVPRLLVVDADPLARQSLVEYLVENDMKVTTQESGRDLEAAILREAIDLVILDHKLPGEDGLRVAQRVRERWQLPIIMLTRCKDEADRVMALELAVDDYLTKPFSPRELLARIRALLRRSQVRETVADRLAKVRAYRFAGWELNVPLRRLTSPTGEIVACTNAEFNLLAAFVSAPHRVLTREQLLALSRLHDAEVHDRTIDVQVWRLRKKIETPGQTATMIRTERGVGYVFDAEVAALR